MQRLSVILVLLGLALATQVRQNVVFRKVSEVTTTRSCWSLTFVIDLNPYVTVMKTVEGNIKNVLGVIQTVVENRAPGTNGLVNDFRGLDNELKTLRENYFGVNAQLGEYHSLHTRTRRSLVPFIGQAFSFLFGTVSEGDLGAIRQNLHILRNNQVELAHVVQESLSLINISRACIAEDRQTLNLIVSDMGALNDQIVNVTQRLDNPIFQLEMLLPMYLQLDSMVEEIKHSAKGSDVCRAPPATTEHVEYRQAVNEYNIPTQVTRPFGRHTDQNLHTTQVARGPKSRSLAFLAYFL